MKFWISENFGTTQLKFHLGSLSYHRSKITLFFTIQGLGSSDKVPGRKLQDLKLGFSEYYLSLVLLQNYQNLNYTGFRKILKKYDKNLKTDAGARWRSEYVDNAMFYTTKDIDKLIQGN